MSYLSVYITGAILLYVYFFISYAVLISIIDKKKFGSESDYTNTGVLSLASSIFWPIVFPISLITFSMLLITGFINKLVAQIVEVVKKIAV